MTLSQLNNVKSASEQINMYENMIVSVASNLNCSTENAENLINIYENYDIVSIVSNKDDQKKFSGFDPADPEHARMESVLSDVRALRDTK
jgi:hypothetical protein